MANVEFLLKEYDVKGLLETDLESIEELQNDYKNGGYYICDMISEVCNNNIHCYKHDLWKSAEDLQEYSESAIDEGYVNTEDEVDLIKIFQAGEMLYLQEQCYDNIDKVIYNYGVDYLKDLYEDAIEDKNTITIQQIIVDILNNDELDFIIGHIDSDNMFSDINEAIDEHIQDKLNEIEESEEEEE